MTTKLKLVCGSCGAVNQFDQSRSTTDAKCGKCKSLLADGKPITVSAQSLSSHITHSGLPVLVDFWAPWCGPCKAFAPTFQRYAASNAASIRCLKLDTEQHQQAGAQFNIRSIPTLALFQSGKEVARISGALGDAQLEQWVKQNLV